MRDLVDFYPELKVGYTGIVTISTDNLLRPSIADLWADLREVTRKVRPDWDITSPEFRAAWERGDRDPFFP